MRKIHRTLSVIAASLFSFAAFGGAPSSAGLEDAHALASKNSITESEIGKIASSLGSPSYYVLFENEQRHVVEFGAGLVRLGEGVGEVFGPATPLTRGVFWNFSQESVWLGSGDGTPVLEVPANGMVVVGLARFGATIGDSPDVIDSIDLISSGGPSVECGTGFYACCCQNQGGSSRRAVCVANNGTAPCTCTHGGPGSTSCSFGSSAAAIDSIDIVTH